MSSQENLPVNVHSLCQDSTCPLALWLDLWRIGESWWPFWWYILVVWMIWNSFCQENLPVNVHSLGQDCLRPGQRHRSHRCLTSNTCLYGTSELWTMESGVDVEDGDVMLDTPGPPAQWGSILLWRYSLVWCPVVLAGPRTCCRTLSTPCPWSSLRTWRRTMFPWRGTLDLALELTGQPESSLTDVYSKGHSVNYKEIYIIHYWILGTHLDRVADSAQGKTSNHRGQVTKSW